MHFFCFRERMEDGHIMKKFHPIQIVRYELFSFFRRYDFMIVMYFENDLHSLYLIRILLPEEYARIPLIDLRKCDIPEVAGIDHICVSALLRILYFLKVLKNKDSRTILNIIFGMLQFLHIGGQYEIILVGK